MCVVCICVHTLWDVYVFGVLCEYILGVCGVCEIFSWSQNYRCRIRTGRSKVKEGMN